MFWAMFRRPRSSSSDAGVTCGHTGEAEPGSYRILGNGFRCLHVGVDRYDVNGNTFRGCLRIYVPQYDFAACRSRRPATCKLIVAPKALISPLEMQAS